MKQLDDNYDEKRKQRIIGILIREERKKKRLSAQQLAGFSGISQQYISEIERGKKQLSYQSLNYIFKALKIDFDDNVDLITEAQHQFELFMGHHLNRNDERYKVLETIVVNKKWKYSFAFPVVMLSQYIYDYYLLRKEGKDINEKAQAKCLDDLFIDLERIHKVVYLYFKGQYYLKQSDIRKALQYYMNMLEQASANSNSWLMQGYKGCANVSIGQIHGLRNKLYDAEEYMKKAISYLKPLNLIRRTFDSEISLGLIYLNQNRFEKANEQLQSTLRFAKATGEDYYLSCVYSNIAVVSFAMRDYKRCIEDSVKALKYNSFLDLYYYLGWSSLKLGQYEDTRKYYDIMSELDLTNDSFVENYRKLIGMYLDHEDRKKIFKHLKLFYEDTMKNEIIDNKKQVLELIIDFCKENEMYKELSYYQDILIDYYKNM